MGFWEFLVLVNQIATKFQEVVARVTVTEQKTQIEESDSKQREITNAHIGLFVTNLIKEANIASVVRNLQSHYFTATSNGFDF